MVVHTIFDVARADLAASSGCITRCTARAELSLAWSGAWWWYGMTPEGA
jgi:hypothetical protein